MLVQHFQVAYGKEKSIVQRGLIYLISIVILLLSINDVLSDMKVKLII